MRTLSDEFVVGQVLCTRRQNLSLARINVQYSNFIALICVCGLE